MKIKACAKINLILNIIGKRDDGYHDVDMIMQTISLADDIEIQKIMSGIEISGTGNIPYDETNLAYKAAKLFFDISGKRGGCKIHIKKHIPVCAGMAGGSTDAAGVLNALNTMYGKPLKPKLLFKISAMLGADVPYCLAGGTARATGIGDIITPLSNLPKSIILVVKPPISVSTPYAYQSLNHQSLLHPDTQAAVEAISEGNMEKLYSVMGNSFEDGIFLSYPQIGEIKERMLELGAKASLMSGSGSAVYAIFESHEAAKNAYNEFCMKYNDVFLTETVQSKN